MRVLSVYLLNNIDNDTFNSPKLLLRFQSFLVTYIFTVFFFSSFLMPLLKLLSLKKSEQNEP